jgi:hypothetical protein
MFFIVSRLFIFHTYLEQFISHNLNSIYSRISDTVRINNLQNEVVFFQKPKPPSTKSNSFFHVVIK